MTPASELHQHFSGNFRRIVEKLARRPGAHADAQDLVDFVYRDDPNGGPDYADGSLKVTIHKQRHKLTEHGWALMSNSGTGGYWLEPLADLKERQAEARAEILRRLNQWSEESTCT